MGRLVRDLSEIEDRKCVRRFSGSHRCLHACKGVPPPSNVSSTECPRIHMRVHGKVVQIPRTLETAPRSSHMHSRRLFGADWPHVPRLQSCDTAAPLWTLIHSRPPGSSLLFPFLWRKGLPALWRSPNADQATCLGRQSAERL